MEITIGSAMVVSSGKIVFSFIKSSFIIIAPFLKNFSLFLAATKCEKRKKQVSRVKKRHTIITRIIVWRKVVRLEKSTPVLAL